MRDTGGLIFWNNFLFFIYISKIPDENVPAITLNNVSYVFKNTLF